MNSRTKPVTGIMVIVIGAAHTTLGVITWLSSTPEKTTENFWFTVFGVLAIALGICIGSVERARGYVPLAVLLAVAVIAGCGIAFMPVSGFLSLLVPIRFGLVGWLRRSRRRPTTA